MSDETIGVTVGAFTVYIPADSEAGRTIAAAALEVLSDPKNQPDYAGAKAND